MANKPLSIVLRTCSALILAAFVLAGVWVAYNLWPRPMPQPLFTKADLPVEADAEKNGWDMMFQIRAHPDFPSQDFQIPDELMTLFNTGGAGNPQKAEAYWAAAEELKPDINSYLQKYASNLQAFQKILAMPQWVDTTPVPADNLGRFLMFLNDFERWVAMGVVQQALDGNEAAAYQLWKQRYLLNLAWTKTARSFLSHVFAITYLRQDFEWFQLLLQHQPPASAAEWIQFFRANPPGDLNLRRAVRYEYVERLSQIEAPPTLAKVEQGTGMKLFFNAAWNRGELNLLFAAIDKVLQGPSSNWESGLKEVDRKVSALKDEPFAWFFNPAGKSMLRLTHVSLVEPAKSFADDRDRIAGLYRETLVDLRQSGQDRLNAAAAPAADSGPEVTPSPSPQPQAQPPAPEKPRDESPAPSAVPDNF